MNPSSTTALPRRHCDDTSRPIFETPEHWWDAAACRFFGPAPFFAPDNETSGQRARRERTAKLICRPCPVRGACLQHALATGESHGVWGGATERERMGVPYPADTVTMETSTVYMY